MAPEEQAISWQVVTHAHKERSTDWYWGLGLLAVAGAAAAAFFGNYLFAIILLIGAASIGTLAARGPREHTIRLDQKGLVLDGTRYKWEAIHSFWVEEREESPRLLLTMNGLLAPHLVLPLTGADAHAVREHMRKHAEEEEQEPHLGEHLAELFGL